MPKLALADQIKALEANTRAAQAGNSMALDNRRFSLDQAKAFNENQMKWIELKMKWNLHAQEVIKKQIENAKSFLELQQMRFAFQQFIIQQRILKNDIRETEDPGSRQTKDTFQTRSRSSRVVTLIHRCCHKPGRASEGSG